MLSLLEEQAKSLVDLTTQFNIQLTLNSIILQIEQQERAAEIEETEHRAEEVRFLRLSLVSTF